MDFLQILNNDSGLLTRSKLNSMLSALIDGTKGVKAIWNFILTLDRGYKELREKENSDVASLTEGITQANNYTDRTVNKLYTYIDGVEGGAGGLVDSTSFDPSYLPTDRAVTLIALGSGTFTNLKDVNNTAITVSQNNSITVFYRAPHVTYWNYKTEIITVPPIDDVPTKNSVNLVTSGGVFDNMGALDISELNATENPHTLATYADLSAALAAIPSNDYKKGGMSIKFVRSSDNKYVQYRCMAQSFTTDVTQWQGVDDEPTVGSENLVKSDGVAKIIGYINCKYSEPNVALPVNIKAGDVVIFSITGRTAEQMVVLSKTSTWDASTNLTVITNGTSDRTVEKTLSENYGYVWISGNSINSVLSVQSKYTTKEILDDLSRKTKTLQGSTSEHTKKLSSLSNEVDGIREETNISYNVISGCYIRYTDGEVVQNSGTDITNDINVEGYEYARIFAFVSSYQDTVAGYAFYDNNGYVSGGKFVGETTTGEEKIIKVPQGATKLRYTLYRYEAGYCYLQNLVENGLMQRVDALEEESQNIKITSKDIYFNLGVSIFNYPTDHVTNNLDINNELEEVSDTQRFTSDIISVADLSGLWKLYYNEVNNYDRITTGFRMTLYSGTSPIKTLYVTNNGNNVVGISKKFVEDNNIDGYRLSCTNVYDWSKFVLTRVCKYDIIDTEKKAYIEKYGINLRDFPREEGETTDDGRFTRALRLAMWGGTIKVPDGNYVVGQSININYWQNIEFEDGAIIEASDTFSQDYVVEFIGGNQFFSFLSQKWTTEKFLIGINGELDNRKFSLKGGVIDANGKAGCLRIDGFRNFDLSNIKLCNPKTYGLYSGGNLQSYELMASKIFVISNISGNTGNIGIMITNTDNHFSDIVVTDCTIGFRINGSSNRLTRCHHWNGPVNNGEYITNSISFEINSPDTVLTDCYADTSEINYKVGENADNTRLIGCGSFSNLAFPVPSCTRIYNDAYFLSVIGCTFSSNASEGGTLVLVGGSREIWNIVATRGLN